MNQNQLREYLFQEDLAHDKEMEKLIKDAQPKKVKDDYKMKLLKAPIITRELIGPEYTAEQQLLDLSLDLQMQNTIKQAMYALDGKTPEPMKGSVTEEMIADYKKEVMKPIEIRGRYHLYRPVEIPPLVRPTPIPYSHGGKKISEATYRRKMQDILDDIKSFEAELTNAHFFKTKLEEEFRLGSSSSSAPPFDEAGRTAQLESFYSSVLITMIEEEHLPVPKKSNKASLVKTLIDHEKSKLKKSSPDLGRIKTDLGLIDADIRHFVNEINGANAAYDRLKADYEQQADVDEENRVRLLDYETKKRNLPHTALSEFNRLNQGKIEVSRQENETDDEFIARLQQLGNIFIDPADMEKQIVTEILLKAKKNILELTNDYDKAESVVRMLDNNERFQMNKAFPMIKKKYSESFGLNNKKLDDVEITQFIKNQLESSQALISPAEKVEKQKISTKLRQFRKPQLEAIIDELNRDDPSLGLKKGTIKEMVDELDSKDIYDAPRFRSLLKMPDIEASVAPIMPVTPAPTPKFSSRSLLAADDDESVPPPQPPRGPPPPPPGESASGYKSMKEILAERGSRPSMASILEGVPKKKGAPAAEPSDRVLRSSEAKPMSLMEEMMSKSKKLKSGSDREIAPKAEKPMSMMEEMMVKKLKKSEPKKETKKEDTGIFKIDDPLVKKMMTRRAAVEDDEEDDNKDKWDGEGLSGFGIKNHVLPSTVPFGKIALDLNKLFYQNVLSIKRHNGNKIIGHKNKRVSDNFVEIILKMFENKPITQTDLKNIKDEQMIYDNLIVQSGLHKLKKIPTNIEQTSEQMKNRLGLITGEIEAGNSNKKLLEELHGLLFKMVRVHLISKNAAAAYYKNIKDTFFNL